VIVGQAVSFAGITQRPLPAWHCMQRPLQALSQHTPSTHRPLAHGVPLAVHAAPRFSWHWPLTNCWPLGHWQLPVAPLQVRPPLQVSQRRPGAPGSEARGLPARYDDGELQLPEGSVSKPSESRWWQGNGPRPNDVT
jgi:hypothetical protein